MGSNRQECGNSCWDEVSYIIRSRYRIAVLEQLSEGPKIPTRIAEAAEFRLAHISRAIQQLRERSLVTLLVSEDQTKGRVYGLTNEGVEAWAVIFDRDLC
ncbi:winged helix-turn-helix domain-containing protein [Halomarina rubra]|uniref:ArsR family transcriptional regulator n=1 Tax=Halomarina rubra TaxID=2071873 RepID=A0ABD6AXD8_9EURY|nr:winged helix-turn-helix domain-containing protein [Halomarina rubra]